METYDEYFKGEIRLLKDFDRLWQIIDIGKIKAIQTNIRCPRQEMLEKLKTQTVKNVVEIVLDPDYGKKISFQEFLVIGKIIHKTPTPLGSLCVNIVNSMNHSDKLIVYLRCAFDLNGRQAGSKITTWLDPHFHTIEEKRSEFLNYCDPQKCLGPKASQSLYMSVQEDNIHIHHAIESCQDDIHNNNRFPKELAQNLISEGGSFALMRVMAQTKYIGQFETTTLYINGDLCRNIYCSTGPESGTVNQKKMDICKIYRRIIEKCGIVHTCCTVMTTTGRIVTHEWHKSDYVIYLNPLVDVSTMQDLAIEPVEKIDCLKDLQLFSKYLDKKQLCTGAIHNYIKEKSDIKTVLADYLQIILQMKPDDAVEFTMKYFTRFADAEWLK